MGYVYLSINTVVIKSKLFVTTHYSLSTSKVIDKNLRIVQISDSHIGATFHAEGFKKHMQTIQNLHPDLIVVTGDYVDDDTTRKDMLASTKSRVLMAHTLSMVTMTKAI